MVLREGPTGWRFHMSEVSLQCSPALLIKESAMRTHILSVRCSGEGGGGSFEGGTGVPRS